jgi:hypothetical protein
MRTITQRTVNGCPLLGIGLLCLFTSFSAQAQNAAAANKSNPQISANAVILGVGSTAHSDEHGDLPPGLLGTQMQLQEIEVRMSANSDPYWRFDASLVSHGNQGGVPTLEVEEAFASSLAIPKLTVRAGRFLAAIGKAGPRHTHARHYIEAPLPYVALLGTGHVTGTGLSLDYLLPLPFFAELKLQGVQADWGHGAHAHDAHSAAKGADKERDQDLDITYVAHLKTVAQMSASLTAELGATALWNPDTKNDGPVGLGGDLTLKWVPPSRSRYTSFAWTTEYLSIPDDAHKERRDGLYTSFRYQRAQRWWTQVRAATLDLAEHGLEGAKRAEVMLAFAPSERTALRLQYALQAGGHEEHGKEEEKDDHDEERHEDGLVHEVGLQLIISIGSHPAHAY